MNKTFIDEYGRNVDLNVEEISRSLVKKYIKLTDHVLELGARYGTVSVFLSEMLNDGRHLVSVEPDPSVKHCLEKNKINNNSKFNILNGVISNEETYLVHHPCVWEQKTYSKEETLKFPSNRKISKIQNYTVQEVENLFNLSFNVLVADCEGFLVKFTSQNQEFISKLDLIIYEEDCTISHPINNDYVDYSNFHELMKKNNFVLVDDVIDNINLHNKVYSKRN